LCITCNESHIWNGFDVSMVFNFYSVKVNQLKIIVIFTFDVVIVKVNRQFVIWFDDNVKILYIVNTYIAWTLLDLLIISPIFEKEHNLQWHCLENPVCYQQQQQKRKPFSTMMNLENTHMIKLKWHIKFQFFFHFLEKMLSKNRSLPQGQMPEVTFSKHGWNEHQICV